jgi:hypothetical protein
MADSARAHLIFSFRKVLRPLVRILIKAGVTFSEFREVIKGAYVEAVIREGIGREGPVSRARIAAHTAVPLADVDRFIDNPRLLAPPDSTNIDTIAEVLHIWNTDSRYVGPFGLPLEVDFDLTPGRNFSELVYRANSSASPQVILDEMIDSGLLVRVGGTHFKTSSRSLLFIDELTPQALEYFGRVMTDLASTLQFNMTVKSEEKRLQRSVFPEGGIPEEALPEFEALIRDRGNALLIEIDDWLSQNNHRWVDRSNVVNCGLTVFYYLTEELDYRPLREMEGLEPSSRLARPPRLKSK